LTKQTTSLSLSKPEITDKIVDTITQLASNFDVIDSSLADIVSYPSISGETGIVKVGYPYGDVRRYGAKGDDTTDDTVAFQKAFDFSAASGYPVLINDLPYKLNSAITLKNNGVYIVRASGRSVLHPQSDVFVGELISTSVTLVTMDMEGLKIDYKGSINSFRIFKGIELLSSHINKNNFQYPGIFLDGYMNYGTRITNNTFFGISQYFIDTSRYPGVSLSDSYIYDNYISGRSSQNPSCFNVNTFDSAFNVSRNWIELFKYVFTYSSNVQQTGCMFADNIVNHCFRLFNPSLSYFNFMFISNSFQVMSKSSNTSNFPNMTADMSTGKWGVFIFDSTETGYIYNTIISNNQVDTCDYYIYISSTFTNQKGCFIKERNTLGAPTNANYYTTRNAGDKSGFLNTYIEVLDNQDMSSIPTPVDASNNAVTVFNNQHVWVAGIMYKARVVSSTITMVQLN
jgi:hypothetical protein